MIFGKNITKNHGQIKLTKSKKVILPLPSASIIQVHQQRSFFPEGHQKGVRFL